MKFVRKLLHGSDGAIPVTVAAGYVPDDQQEAVRAEIANLCAKDNDVLEYCNRAPDKIRIPRREAAIEFIYEHRDQLPYKPCAHWYDAE